MPRSHLATRQQQQRLLPLRNQKDTRHRVSRAAATGFVFSRICGGNSTKQSSSIARRHAAAQDRRRHPPSAIRRARHRTVAETLTHTHTHSHAVLKRSHTPVTHTHTQVDARTGRRTHSRTDEPRHSTMPRVAVRRKALTNNNDGEEDQQPKRKLARQLFKHPMPRRPTVVGSVLVCGQGDMGQLGLGDDESKYERKRPALVESLKDVVDVRAGGMHNLVLTRDGVVHSFGCNDEGALGRDSSEDGSEFEPLPIALPGKVLKISAGDSHSACLLEDGRVFAWGSFRDSHGNMGLTLEGNKRLPINVLPGVECCDVASGADHLVILTRSGKVYTVGCGEQGQLGRVSLRSASGESRRGKTELLRPGMVYIKNCKPIELIWATNYCTFLQESQTNNIWAFGLNNYKQLAYSKEMSVLINPILTAFKNVKQIAGGQHHTLILKENGSCYAIGRRDYGRLGVGNVDADLTELKSIAGLAGKKIVSVSCGEAQSFALSADGKLYSWGMGSNHQLGTGSEDDEMEPVLIESKQTIGKCIVRAESGGQHSIFLVQNELKAPVKKTNKVKNNNDNDDGKEKRDEIVPEAAILAEGNGDNGAQPDHKDDSAGNTKQSDVGDGDGASADVVVVSSTNSAQSKRARKK